MPTFAERFRNLFRNELVLPAPQKTAQEVEMESRKLQEKIAEGFKMGVSETVRELSADVVHRQSELFNAWSNQLAYQVAFAARQPVEEINSRHTARLHEINAFAGHLDWHVRDKGVLPEYDAPLANVQKFTREVHLSVPGLAEQMRAEISESSVEVTPSRYEYLDAAIQQLSQAPPATTAREVSQSWAVSQPQQYVFIQPERAQQLAVETPELQQDFGVSL